MALIGSHGAFQHPGVSRIDYKTLDMDRVLTAFLARLWHRGLPSRIARAGELSVDNFVNRFLNNPDVFDGFDRDTTTRWAATHLLDMVNRGRANEAVAGPRPLHGFTYRFRNSRKSRPYGADEQLYEMLYAAHPEVLQELREFFFSDVDRATGAITPGADTDVETQALLHLVSKAFGQIADRADESKPRRPYPPLCQEPGRLLAEDVMALLHHQAHMPRTVLVEYLKVLFAFHLSLYHLRLIKLLPQAVANAAVDVSCAKGHTGASGGGCRYQPRLFVAADLRRDAPAAVLAGHSAELWYRRIPRFVEATYAVRKLDEFAVHQVKKQKLTHPKERGYFSAAEVIALPRKTSKGDRDNFFAQRLNNMIDDNEADLPAEMRQIIALGLDPFSEYIETLMHFKGRYHRGQVVDCLDSLLLKNRPGALLAQPRGTRGERRFVLDSTLLEVLLQVSLVRPGTDGAWRTAPLRVDTFLELLRERYGLYIDQLPNGDGFFGPQIDDQAALRANSAAFLHRLREIGYYQDMSDAYLTQTITPRYTIGVPVGAAGAEVTA